MSQALTVNEVAAIAGLDESRVRKEVEYGLFGSASPPRFGLPAVVYFRILALLGIHLGVEDRKKLYALIAKAFSGSRKPKKVQVSSVLELKLDEVTEEVADTLARFEAWKKNIVSSEEILGGEPVFPKSRLAVRHIGGMLINDVPLDEIREDHSHLTEEDIEFAKLYTTAYPRVGRPRERKAPAR